MRRPQGYHVTIDVNGQASERDTFQCGHCQYIVDVEPFSDPVDMGGLCRVCDRLICRQCVDSTEGCAPFEKEIERIERRWESNRRRAEWG